ncbi:unnamed protein product [Linum tenue]|uniref:peptidylprolyl isomerase n=1 Tax=Linum tenue TaxID=586396 RepID=A0AAV0J5V0_9ROSI|nr:unnamed protein product [Linum tenue]
MGFWGIEVKPGKPHPYHSDNVEGTLCVTQATLGLGKSTDRSILQCSVGHKSPVFLCSLLPDKNESCPLTLEFKDELVAFSVVGKRSIHLSGYFVADEGDYVPDDDSGEDIGDTESDDESSEFEYGDDEIDDDEEPTNGVGLSKLKKKKNGRGGVSVLESEDEDGFPVSATEEGGKAIIQCQPKESKKNKRKVKATTEPESQPEKKKQKQKGNEETVADMVEDDQKVLSGDETQPADAKQGSPVTNEGDKRETEVVEGSVPSKGATKKNKKKKKKNKKASGDGESTVEKAVSGVKSDGASDEKQSASKSSNVRTFSNGLVIEDVAMGKPDAKRAYPGSQVSVRYTGKLKENGKVFDSNEGRAPFIFRLGVGQVIKGWDVGVNGMRAGDKRRLTIPPAMGYGHEGAGNKIPPNSWLVFDVELVNVR